MYANPEAVVQPIQNRQTVNERHDRPSFRVFAIRFLNWFGSGGSAPHMIKADHGHGTDFIMIHGHIVPDPSCREATGADYYTR
jgi:hypothetical protein